MPWTNNQPSLPWSGRSPHAKATSYKGAKFAAPRAETQAGVYYQWLISRGLQGATDHEAVAALGFTLNVVNARRNYLVDFELVFDSGETRKGPSGVENVVWVAERCRQWRHP